MQEHGDESLGALPEAVLRHPAERDRADPVQPSLSHHRDRHQTGGRRACLLQAGALHDRRTEVHDHQVPVHDRGRGEGRKAPSRRREG